MSDLKFYEETHQYELDGELLPSVSEIIRFISKEHYADINPVYIERAADRGTRIHMACAQLDLTGECDVDEDIVPYVEAYTAFLKDYKPQWTHIESAMYHPTMRYAGTIDRIGIIEGKTIMVDIKSSSAPYVPSVEAQLGGYHLLADASNIYVAGLQMLQLLKTGKYRLATIDESVAYNLFTACHLIHMTTAKKKKGDGLLLV